MECTSYNAFRFESTPVNQSSSSTTTSSWVGMNSDDDDVSGRSSNGGDCDENEVQSSYNGALDTMDTLQQVLPIRRGISSFYNGKSKSFTSLVEASSTSSVKEIAKPENAYTRRRRNLLAINHAWDRNRLKKRPARSMISKKKRTLALLAVAMSSSGSTTTDDSISNFMPSASSFAPTLKPQLLSII